MANKSFEFQFLEELYRTNFDCDEFNEEFGFRRQRFQMRPAKVNLTELSYKKRDNIVLYNLAVTGEIIFCSFEDAEIVQCTFEDFSYCSLRDASIHNSKLYGLGSTDLGGACIKQTSFYGTLEGCNFSQSSLNECNLADVRFEEVACEGMTMLGCDLRGASYSPLDMLKMNFYSINPSEDLIGDMMAYDAAHHPHPELFEEWAKGGACPYSSKNVERAIPYFKETKSAWGKGKGRTGWQIWEELAKLSNISL